VPARLGLPPRITWLVLPALALYGVVFVYPLVRLAVLSFMAGGEASLANYAKFFGTPLYVDVLVATMRVAASVTIICVALGYVVAFVIAHASARVAALLTVLVITPLLISVLVRSFAWISILSGSGVVNSALLGLGITDAPVEILYTGTAVLIGLTHVMLPYAILPILSTMLGIDPNLGRAAASLGAPPWRSFLTVYLPLSLPGVAAAALLTFIITIGFYITPALLGGRRDLMISQLVEVQVQRFLDWGFAATISVVLVVVTLGVVAALGRVVPITAFVGGGARR
jgi:ABC-type spermidine/putrescine transport system permease subunit I